MLISEKEILNVIDKEIRTIPGVNDLIKCRDDNYQEIIKTTNIAEAVRFDYKQPSGPFIIKIYIEIVSGVNMYAVCSEIQDRIILKTKKISQYKFDIQVNVYIESIVKK